MMTPVGRVSVVGNAGAGQTRLATRVAAILDAPHVELDAIHHLPAGTRSILTRSWPRSARSRPRTDGLSTTTTATSSWMGQCGKPPTTVVWLDLPRRTVMRQVITRTLRRVIRCEQLRNGNREPIWNLYALDPSESIIRWA